MMTPLKIRTPSQQSASKTRTHVTLAQRDSGAAKCSLDGTHAGPKRAVRCCAASNTWQSGCQGLPADAAACCACNSEV